MPHHLDHLAPFAWKKKAPLWIEETHIAKLARHYYPDVEIIEKKFDFKEASEMADIIVVSTKAAPIELKSIYSSMGNNSIIIAYLPHGQSDKGLNDPNLRSIEHTDLAYLYGKLQHQRVKEFGTINTINSIEFTGNFRLEYYKENKQRLDKITENEIFQSFDHSKKTLLYAPTWSHKGFIEHTQTLIENTTDYNLIIKLHPLIEKTHPAYACLFEGYNKTRQGLSILINFPLIYPILSRTDIYIGDESAIGYDFLYYKKPMFFLTEEETPLTQCGKKVSTVEKLMEELKHPEQNFTSTQQAYYKNAFEAPSLQNM